MFVIVWEGQEAFGPFESRWDAIEWVESSTSMRWVEMEEHHGYRCVEVKSPWT